MSHRKNFSGNSITDKFNQINDVQFLTAVWWSEIRTGWWVWITVKLYIVLMMVIHLRPH